MDGHDAACPINLIGRIHHSVPNGAWIDRNHNRKRQSPDFVHENSTPNKKNNIGKCNQRLLPGFSFLLHYVEQIGSDGQVSARNSGLAENAEFSLVVPLILLKMACHAAATQQMVKITHFSVIKYRENRGELICGQNGIMRGVEVTVSKAFESIFSFQSYETRKNNEECNNLVVIELHKNGLTLETIDCNSSFNPIIPEIEKKATILSLKTLFQKEHQHSSSTSKIGRGKKTFGKEPIDVTGVVDAISPVLVNHTNDEPFAIVELYQPGFCKSNDATSEETDDHNSVYTAVAVIRGEKALCMHPAIQPGQSITLLGVISRKWKLPEDLRKRLNEQNTSSKGSMELYHRLSGRVPDRVILVSDQSSIRWNEHHVDDTTIPSTIEQLHCAQGIVESINFHCPNSEDERNSDNVLHFVTLTSSYPRQQTTIEKELDTHSSEYTIDEESTAEMFRIYLPRHVLCPNLLLGIQPGAILRALNIHKRDKFCYIACLRSTVTIECCAAESSFSPSFSHPRFLPSAKPYYLVPEHLVSSIEQCSLHSVSSTQCIWEDKFKLDLKPKWSNIVQGQANDATETHLRQTNFSSLETAVCALLEHCNGVGGEKKTQHTRNTNSKDRINQLRDPYAEFFDHGHDHTVLSEVGCGNSSYISFQNDGRFCNTPSCSIPVVYGINELWHGCCQDFIRRVQAFVAQYTSVISSRETNSSPSMSGWTCSHHYAGLELCNLLRDYSKNENSRKYSAQKVYSWGDFEWDRNVRSSIPSYIFHGNFRIPVSLPRRSMFAFDEYLQDYNQPILSSGWLQIESVIVTAVCLGPRSSEANVGKKNNDQNNVGGIFFNEESFFVVNDLLFTSTILFTAAEVVSFYPIVNSVITSKRRRLPTGFSEMDSCEVDGDPLRSSDFIGIQECLEHHVSDENNDTESFLLGLLIRQRFKFRRPKRSNVSSASKSDVVEKFYEGWTITLSHISSAEFGVTSAATLQTIQVQISVPVPFDEDDLGIKCRMNSYGMIRPDQVTMGLAWKAAAGIRNILPVLSGGWDECNNQLHDGNRSSTPHLPFVYVKIPLSSRSFSKLGYQRFKCGVHDVESFFVFEPNDPGLMESDPICFFPSSNEFSGLSFCPRVGKFLPGMRNRRIRKFGNSVSAIHCNDSSFLRIKAGDGVPSVSLADIHMEMCEALKHGTKSTLRPSLLRRIRNIKILGISFCRAQAECTQCFHFLSSGHDNREKMKSLGSSHLFCPSGCSTSLAKIKWECSAIIDDGSGQAKLYAEREAALLLLGNGLLVNEIEIGAMESPSGILFQPSLPVSVNLIESIKTASSTVKNLKNRERHTIPNKDRRSMHDFLPPIAKAEYPLQYHCRRWHQRSFHLSMDIFCRCKPLSADLTSVNQSEIPVAHACISEVGIDFGSVFTSTLPPLRLALEDACLSGEGMDSEIWQGWDTINNLR